MSRLIDLSHEIDPGMVTYAGLPGPIVSDFLSHEESRGKYAEGTTFTIGRLEMVANTGTYLDAPFHRFVSGRDVGSLPLEKLADLEGIVVDATRSARAIGPERLDGLELGGKAVLVNTGWSRHWRTAAYFDGHPYRARPAVERLVAARPALVGIDSLNIDDTRDGTRPAHTLLLEAEVPVVEHLTNLESLPASGFRFHCAPAPFHGLGSFPVRAYAVIGTGRA